MKNCRSPAVAFRVIYFYKLKRNIFFEGFIWAIYAPGFRPDATISALVFPFAL